MRYARAKWKEYQENLAYRIYITDSLQLYSQNKYFTKRYIDLIHPHANEWDANEVAFDIIKRAGLKMETENEL